MKGIIKVICIFASVSIVCSGIILIHKNHTDKTMNHDVISTADKITDISNYNQKIKIDMNANLPPADILSLGGNGLQLYDTEGNFIDGDITLDCSKEFTSFLRVVWLESYASDCSLILLVDNHVQKFSVDGCNQKISLLNVCMQPKSSLNIPITIDAEGDHAVANSTLTFLFLSYDMKKSDSGTGDTYQYPNSTNNLSYKIKTNVKKEYSEDTTAATNYIEQNSKNQDFIKSGAFYSVLSSRTENNFMFYQEDQSLNISKNNYCFYAMGQSKGMTFLFKGDQLINAFNNRPYLTYELSESIYLKQAVNFDLSSIAEGNRLMIINIQQSNPSYYSVISHNLSLTQ